MNELQTILLENELRRHYLHELLGSDYETLMRFMQAILEAEAESLEEKRCEVAPLSLPKW